MQTCLTAQNLSFQYKGGKLLQFLDFELPATVQMLLLGKSGSGKTTLLKLLSGLLSCESGKVICFGQDLGLMSVRERDVFRAKQIGLALSDACLLPALSLEENLLLAQFIAWGRHDSESVKQLLELLRMKHLASKKTQEMSQGEQQRTILCMALVKNPPLILADEPTAHLDDDNCEAVIKLLLKLATQNKTAMLIATHDARLKPYFKTVLHL